MNSNIQTSDEIEDEVLLTTLDNPFNPHLQWDDWYAFDKRQGYNTCEYLARIAKSSDELSEVEQTLAIRQAMDEILRFNVTGNYVLVDKDLNRNAGIHIVE